MECKIAENKDCEGGWITSGDGIANIERNEKELHISVFWHNNLRWQKES